MPAVTAPALPIMPSACTSTTAPEHDSHAWREQLLEVTGALLRRTVAPIVAIAITWLHRHSCRGSGGPRFMTPECSWT